MSQFYCLESFTVIERSVFFFLLQDGQFSAIFLCLFSNAWDCLPVVCIMVFYAETNVANILQNSHITLMHVDPFFQFIKTYKSIKKFCATTFNWIGRFSGIRFILTGNLRKNCFYLRLLEIRNHQNINIYLTPRRQFCSWKLLNITLNKVNGQRPEKTLITFEWSTQNIQEQ